MAKLPTVVSNLAPDLRAFLNRVREAIDGKGGNRLVSVDDLITGGVVVPGPGGTIVPPGSGLVNTPPAPRNVTATGGVNNVFVEWDDPKYYGHAYAEVWGADTDNIGAAVSLGMAPGVNFVDTLDPDSTRYYWVRFVNILDVAGPYNAVSGTLGQTTIEVEHVLDVLTGAIKEEQLYADLGSRINLIDGPSTLAGSVAARVLAEANARGAAILTETNARSSADSSIAQSVTVLAAQVNDSTTGLPATRATLIQDYYTRTDVDGAISSSANYLRAYSNINSKTFRQPSAPTQRGVDPQTGASIPLVTGDFWIDTDSNPVNKPYQWNGSAWVDATDGAIASVDARVTNVENAKIGYCSTPSGVATDHVDRATCELAGNVWNVGLPLSQAVKQVSVSDGDNNLSLEQRFTAQKNTNGTLSGQYTVKIDNNGYVSGFGLASTPVNGTPYSSFTIRADKFSIAAPSGPGITPLVPFTVVTTPTVINGTNVPTGVYINGGFIQGGSITGSAIIDGTITGTKLIDVSANKITGAALLSTSYIESYGYVEGSQGWKIGGSGVAEFAAASIRGQLSAAQMNGTGLSITKADGTVILNAGTGNFTGSLDGTAVSTVVSNASSAKTAADAATAALATKIGTDTRSVLSGGGGIAIGSLNWDTTGNRTSGYGIGITSAGVAAFKSNGTSTFVLNGGTGDASFGGALSAATGTFAGSLSAATGTFSGILSAGQIAIGTSSGATTFYDPFQPSVDLSSGVTGFLAYNGDTGVGTYVPATCQGKDGPYDCSYYTYAAAPVTSSELEFITNSPSVPVTRRVRTGSCRFTIIASGTVDHYFSIWYRYKLPGGSYGAWTHIATSIEPQSSYGATSVSGTFTASLSIGSGVQFGMAALDSSGAYWNAGLRDIRFGTITVTGFNF